jgi:hypothetical protein
MGDPYPRVSTRLVLGYAAVAVLLVGGAAAELFVHRPVAAVMLVILGLGSWGLATNRLPSRWFYAASGAAFLAALLIAPFNHDERVNTIGSVLLAVGIGGGIETFGLRFMHEQLSMDEARSVDS